MVRAYARAFTLSVMPGNKRRTSMAAVKFALLLKDGADRCGFSFGDEEHPSMMGTQVVTGKCAP